MRWWPFNRDRLTARIASCDERLVAIHKRYERELRFPTDELPDWWTIVVLRSAAAGAAVGLGELERAAWPAGGSSGGVLKLVTGDPTLEVLPRLLDWDATRLSYRCWLWAYTAEITAGLWSERYESEMQAAARLFHTENADEQRITSLGRDLAAAPAEDKEQLASFRSSVLEALASAAFGRELAADPDWIASMWPKWLPFYRRGRQIADERLKQLATQGLHLVGS